MDYDIWPNDPQDAMRQTFKQLHVHDKSELGEICFCATYCLPELSRLRNGQAKEGQRPPAGAVPEKDASSVHNHEHGLFKAGSNPPRFGFQLYGCRIDRSGEAPTVEEVVRMLPSKREEKLAIIKEWCKRPPRELVVWFIVRKGADGAARICFLGASRWREYVAQRSMIESMVELRGRLAFENAK